MKNKDNLNKSGRRDDPSPATISDETFESLVRKDEIRKEVEAQIRKEVEFLKESLGLSIKIVSVSVMLFLALLGYFGYTTWEGFEKKSVSIMEEKTDKLITKNDSETGVKYRLTSLLNKAVVATALMSVSVDSIEGNRRRRQLSVNDWERLSSSIQDKNLSLQDFKDTLAVLNVQSYDRKRKDSIILNEFISSAINVSLDSVRSKPEKVEAIFDMYKDKYLGKAAVAVIVSDEFEEPLKTKAANYVKEVGYSAGVRPLMDYYVKLQSGPAKRAVLSACILLAPNESRALKELELLNSKPGNYEVVLTLAELIVAIARDMKDGVNDRDIDSLQVIAKSLFKMSSKAGVFFSYAEYDDNEDILFDDVTVVGELPRLSTAPVFQLWVSNPIGGRAELRAVLSLRAMRNFGYYWKFLMDSANSGDIESLKAMLPRVYDEESKAAYEGFNKSYRILVDGGIGADILVESTEGKSKNIVFPRMGKCQLLAETKFGQFNNARNEKGLPVLYLKCADVHDNHKLPVKDIKGNGYVLALKKKGVALKLDRKFYPEYDEKNMSIGP